MVVHKKHLHLDAMVHAILGSAMMAGGVAIILELRRPNCFLLSALRSFTLCMQGIWMIAVGLPNAPQHGCICLQYPLIIMDHAKPRSCFKDCVQLVPKSKLLRKHGEAQIHAGSHPWNNRDK